MSRNSRRKKWKKEEVKRKVLEHLITLTEKGEETTKYKIQKALGVPLSTLLQAIKNLEEEGLVEHEEGKRGSHRCRLTLKGLTYCVDKRIIDSKRAVDVLLKMFKNNEVTEDEMLEEIESKLKRLNKELEELIEAVRMFRQKLKEIL